MGRMQQSERRARQRTTNARRGVGVGNLWLPAAMTTHEATGRRQPTQAAHAQASAETADHTLVHYKDSALRIAYCVAVHAGARRRLGRDQASMLPATRLQSRPHA
jgi:hypothetical protein